jgi:hypothetical protein
MKTHQKLKCYLQDTDQHLRIGNGEKEKVDQSMKPGKFKQTDTYLVGTKTNESIEK